jgi:hypothetical protein
MLPMQPRTLAPLLLMFLAAACSPPKATFTVEVMNITPTPLSVGLIKNGPSAEPEWDTPERIAIQAPQLADRKWGTLVGPGQTKVLSQTGTFREGDLAALRVYSGDLTISEMISYGRNDPGRLDIYLWPGSSGYLIEKRNGKLSSKPLEPRRNDASTPAPGTPPAKPQ